jgi:hypothetical protein
METFRTLLRITTFFVLQLLGVLLISDGLRMIWPPLSPIFNGAVLTYVGHCLYLELTSEEIKK